MARQRQIRICREGLIYSLVMVAALSGAVGRQLNLLMLVGSLLAGPLLFGLVYGRLALRRLKVERKLPPHLHSDQRLVVDVSVSNLRRWLGIWAIEVEDHVGRDEALEAPAAAGVFFPHIAARQTTQVSYAGRLPRRGRYQFGPFRVTTRFPLGLIRHTVVLNESEVLLVRPKLGRLTRDWAQIARENAVGGQRMQRRGLLEADFYGLRDWRAGDSRRWIHWRTSARRGSLVVRQFEQRRSQDLALLVDLWQPSDPSENDLQHVETAVSFVATVVAQACRETGRQLVLALAAQEPLYRSGAASPLFFEEQMDALSLAAAHNEPRFPNSLGRALSLVPLSMSTLIVSTRSIDWAALQAVAIQGDAPLSGRPLQVLNVAGPQFARYFQN
jgi:uncharacterized protein (DUF58 family)